jgi:hypothetical protein
MGSRLEGPFLFRSPPGTHVVTPMVAMFGDFHSSEWAPYPTRFLLDTHVISLHTFDNLWHPYDECADYCEAFPIGKATLIAITSCNALQKN